MLVKYQGRRKSTAHDHQHKRFTFNVSNGFTQDIPVSLFKDLITNFGFDYVPINVSIDGDIDLDVSSKGLSKSVDPSEDLKRKYVCKCGKSYDEIWY